MRQHLSRVDKWTLWVGAGVLVLLAAAAGLGTAAGAKGKRLHLVLITAEDEYRTHETLPAFAAKYLARDFKVTHVREDATDPNRLVGIEALKDADVLLLSVRRRALPSGQLALLRKFVADGKPLAAIRTSSHAFTLAKGKSLPAGHEEWREFDRDVLGGNYTGHHGSKGPRPLVRIVPEAARHPVLTGLPAKEFAVASWLYKTSPLSKTATPLLSGRVEGKPMPEPVAWTSTHSGGGRVFYTSLGHPDDFRIPAFRRLLRNGVYWVSGLPVPSTEDRE
jgi:type 1 glutamine amidotransferase